MRGLAHKGDCERRTTETAGAPRSDSGGEPHGRIGAGTLPRQRHHTHRFAAAHTRFPRITHTTTAQTWRTAC